ncbi:Hint domain-containing protein [Monaibacterium marinum]|uniref:Hint domain-containing protein n=1 Tax=Pontivivens marinum TaxID=1690039 RepID=A0A2C9CS56_9RHOB|nr:Hint domain-containing protein [Monaibacterium marinum]SOH93995.1 Hint domain-containing protein [Monaibacterium marinum]
MYYLYVYSPSDFVSGLPIESGAQAAGSPTFSLTLKAGATPTLIKVDDDEAVFDEVDGTQSLDGAVTIDGNSFADGTTINTAYDLINTANGHKVTSFHFGGDGYQQGEVDGIASTVLLTPGTTYTFNTERTSHQMNNLYDDYVACFTAGTVIATQRGPVAVQDLVTGDMIRTLDRGYQPLRLVLQRHLSAAELIARPKLCPILIEAGALGQGMPCRDLRVSPQHRFLANSPIVQRMFGESEVLISAKKLTQLPGISEMAGCTGVTYFHLVMDQHEVVFAEGAPTESFYFGPMAIRGLGDDARQEMVELFPDMVLEGFVPSGAREIPCSKRQSQFAWRHERNGKSVLTDAVLHDSPS